MVQIVDVEWWRIIVEVVATSTITATKGQRGNGPRWDLGLLLETRGRCDTGFVIISIFGRLSVPGLPASGLRPRDSIVLNPCVVRIPLLSSGLLVEDPQK